MAIAPPKRCSSDGTSTNPENRRKRVGNPVLMVFRAMLVVNSKRPWCSTEGEGRLRQLDVRRDKSSQSAWTWWVAGVAEVADDSTSGPSWLGAPQSAGATKKAATMTRLGRGRFTGVLFRGGPVEDRPQSIHPFESRPGIHDLEGRRFRGAQGSVQDHEVGQTFAAEGFQGRTASLSFRTRLSPALLNEGPGPFRVVGLHIDGNDLDGRPWGFPFFEA